MLANHTRPLHVEPRHTGTCATSLVTIPTESRRRSVAVLLMACMPASAKHGASISFREQVLRRPATSLVRQGKGFPWSASHSGDRARPGPQEQLEENGAA